MIDLKTGKQIGLTIPPNVLARADRGNSVKTSKNIEILPVPDCRARGKEPSTTGTSRKIQAFGLTLFLVGFSVSAQAQPAKTPRIGYLSAIDAETESTRIEAIRLALREAGYVEGQTVTTEYRYADGNLDRISALAAELVRQKVDLIVVTGGDPVIRAAKNAASTTPIVMVGGGLDPVGAGFVQSLARPGGNVTGLTNLSTELSGKRLELLRAAVPSLARVAVLYNAAIPGNVLQLKEIQTTAPGLKLSVQALEVRHEQGFEAAFAVLRKQRPDGLYVPGGPVMNDNGKRITNFALRNRLPSIYSRREFVHAGGLMSYGADLAHSYRRVAYYVDKILKGAKPGDLPIEQPTKFELVINLKTAKQIRLAIPPNVLARADRVIK
jgi:putative tryptophan/tyrosine transport system substrate-binding protein